jgi:hypothetical protein
LPAETGRQFVPENQNKIQTKLKPKQEELSNEWMLIIRAVSIAGNTFITRKADCFPKAAEFVLCALKCTVIPRVRSARTTLSPMVMSISANCAGDGYLNTFEEASEKRK